MQTHDFTTVDLLKWIKKARPGDSVVYALDMTGYRQPVAMTAARELFDTARVMLYQRPITVPSGRVGFEYVAQAISPRAARFISKVSRSIPTPYNPYAERQCRGTVQGNSHG